MSLMFNGATLFNQPLAFNTSQVTDMRSMFEDATAFNQTLNWFTSEVTDMSAMFMNATAFNQSLDWDTAQVTDMRYMFHGATAFNQPLDWDTAQVTDMEEMFTVHLPLWYKFLCACINGDNDVVVELLKYSAEQMGTEEEYRQRLEKDAAKVQNDQLNKLTLSQFVKSSFSHYPTTPKLEEEDIITGDNIVCPVRCLPCKHAYEAETLKTWFRTAVIDYGKTHTDCPKCRKTPKYIEIMNERQVKRWNDMFDDENKAEDELKDLRGQMDENKTEDELKDLREQMAEVRKTVQRNSVQVRLKSPPGLTF